MITTAFLSVVNSMALQWEIIAKGAGQAAAAYAIPWLLNKISGSPQRQGYEQFVEQQQPMLDLLQQQATGKETPASRLIESRIQQQANRGKQAAAASATRRGLGEMARVSRQQNINQQTQQATADALAQLQLGAQQQYGGLMQQMGQMRQGLTDVELNAQARLSRVIGEAIQEVTRDQNDAWLAEIAEWFKNSIPTASQAAQEFNQPSQLTTSGLGNL